MFRKMVLLAVSVSAVLGAAAQKREVMLDKVVAVVGGSAILHSQVEEAAREMVAQRRAQGYTSDRDPFNEALEGLMTRKLLYNQAQIDSVDVNTGEIVSRVEEQVQQMIDMAGSIRELETQHHMAIFNIREILRQNAEEQAYANAMQGEVVNKVKVIPGEVERFYKTIDKDSLPMIAEQYVYAQITKYPKSMVEAKQRTRERLLDMRERIITGQARFENLARMYSVDGSAMRGGELDPTPLAGFDQMIEKRGNLYRARHILLRPVYTSDELGASLQTLDSLAAAIRSDSITFEKAALRHSDDASSKMNGGIVSNHDILERYNAYDARLTQTKFLKEDFGKMGYKSIDDYNAISRLEVGGVSDAYLTEDMLGNQLAKIVKLVEVIPTHKASLNEDYLSLEEMALNAKQERVFRDWLSKRIDAMYVYIAPEYRDGAFENKLWVK